MHVRTIHKFRIFDVQLIANTTDILFIVLSLSLELSLNLTIIGASFILSIISLLNLLYGLKK